MSRKRKAWSRAFGMGDLIGDNGCKIQFEVDGEIVLAFEWVIGGVGKPDYVLSEEEDPATDDPDNCNWMTYKTNDREVFSFRLGGPPPEQEELCL